MNKSVTFRFIDNTKLKMIKAIYDKKLFDLIPVFISKDIDTFIVVEISNKLALILNKEYEQLESKDILYIKLMYALLTRKVYNTSTLDILNAYWNGFNNTINVIKSMETVSNLDKDIRVRHLLGLMISNTNMRIPDRLELLNKLDYIEI